MWSQDGLALGLLLRLYTQYCYCETKSLLWVKNPGVWCLLRWYTTGVKSVHSQWLAINIGKLPFPWNAQFSFLKSIILFLSCRFEDISQVSMPRENIFELTAEHKTYKVYTPKVIFNWTDLFHQVRSCCALKQGSKTLVDMCMCFKVIWSTSNFMIPIYF